ncbi:MAG: hypothetical protein HY898_19790 [Deltaproteobacteria bacterium]|nr:hypothetical protein [Deltaproteobacteria bacterium]
MSNEKTDTDAQVRVLHRNGKRGLKPLSWVLRNRLDIWLVGKDSVQLLKSGWWHRYIQIYRRNTIWEPNPWQDHANDSGWLPYHDVDANPVNDVAKWWGVRVRASRGIGLWW